MWAPSLVDVLCDSDPNVISNLENSDVRVFNTDNRLVRVAGKNDFWGIFGEGNQAGLCRHQKKSKAKIETRATLRTEEHTKRPRTKTNSKNTPNAEKNVREGQIWARCCVPENETQRKAAHKQKTGPYINAFKFVAACRRPCAIVARQKTGLIRGWLVRDRNIRNTWGTCMGRMKKNLLGGVSFLGALLNLRKNYFLCAWHYAIVVCFV